MTDGRTEAFAIFPSLTRVDKYQPGGDTSDSSLPYLGLHCLILSEYLEEVP